LSADDRMRAHVIERLMCDLVVDLGARAGAMDFSDELHALGRLIDAGIVRRAGRQIIVTEEGRPFVRLVAAAFDTYLLENQKRHSVAI
jgi:oxygen-independent coproporphyrinogen-3 oxidase